MDGFHIGQKAGIELPTFEFHTSIFGKSVQACGVQIRLSHSHFSHCMGMSLDTLLVALWEMKFI